MVPGWSKVKENYNWEDFTKGLCERFKERGMMDVVVEFNSLRQERTVIEYHMKFEELKSLMLSRNPYMTEEYFKSSFVGGLNDELRSAIKVLKPRTV